MYEDNDDESMGDNDHMVRVPTKMLGIICSLTSKDYQIKTKMV